MRSTPSIVKPMVSSQFVWPPDFKNWAGKSAVAEAAADRIVSLCPHTRVVVQAGGCSGLWPITLAQHFEHVYTFEPAVTNFDCLQQNIAGISNISAFNHALSDTRRLVGLTRTKVRAGMWQVNGPGDILAVTLDDFLGDIAVDALVLDVEGSELAAWRGAERLIATCRPVLWYEFNRNEGALESWLAEHEYTRPQAGIGRDRFSVPKERVGAVVPR